MSMKGYRKLAGAKGIYRNESSKNFLAIKKVDGKIHQKTFSSLTMAKKWRDQLFGEESIQVDEKSISSENGVNGKCGTKFSTLKEVWDTMQRVHFPHLAKSTQAIWIRRYGPWKILEDLPMDQITPTKVTSWVQDQVTFYKSQLYQGLGRRKAGRCNLNNELNIFVTIFNWYKESEEFEKEAMPLTCPIKKKHRQMGFIQPAPDKKKQISLEDAFLFFQYLKPLYRDLAQVQFYIAGRVGETAGIQWSNVDLENRRMIVKHVCVWDMKNKMFLELKPFPKNKESRVVYITDELREILLRRKTFQLPGNDFVFHVDGNPLNYCTIQLNYREAQRKSGVPYSGTHILRHGMAKLARKVGGGLDAVLAMTGHKDIKLADHYSKCDEDDQKEFSEKIMDHIRKVQGSESQSFENVISLFGRPKQKLRLDQS